jgi:spore germination protein KC
LKFSKFGVHTALFCAALIAIFIFSGHSHTVEIQDRLLCHALGIDFSDGEFEVSAQVFKPSGTGSDTPVDITQSNIEIVGGRGKTVSEALKMCENTRGKEIFLGHLQLICLGKSVELANPRSLFEFCLRDKSVYLGVDICQSNTTAKELMKVELSNDMLATENYVEVIERNAEKSRTMRCRLLDLLSCGSDGQCVGIPVLAVIQPSKEDEELTEPVLAVKDTDLVTDGKTADVWLDPDNSAGLFLMHDGSKEADLVLQDGGEDFSICVSKKRCNAKIEQGSGALLYKAHLTVVVHRMKNAANAPDPETIGRKVAQKLTEQFDGAFKRCVNEQKADAFGICKRLRQSYPKTFLEHENNIESLYETAQGKLEIECLVE